MNAQYPVVTICGSMRYYAAMLYAAADFTAKGFIVLMPHVSVDEETNAKTALDNMHFEKIRMSDGILVVGKHRGESTTNEIAYAKSLGKWVDEV